MSLKGVIYILPLCVGKQSFPNNESRELTIDVATKLDSISDGDRRALRKP
ncbi:hypothetical protein [Phaffia rhodozyma]|uniref:Uncharacterized protein n=1 Tax=Phaffia rhodozyma TaxID=264483 RepID=A0A0F7SIX5_PHARH|nr:hypothetical protein [Phaffia rhodozyma]